MNSDTIITSLTGKYPVLEKLGPSILSAASMLIECYERGGKALICGNGGSNSDADHIAGELMKSFASLRPLNQELKDKLKKAGGERGAEIALKLETGLPAISLGSQTGLITAIANDTDPELIFAQQVISYADEGDVLIAISTSGNSGNVIDACIAARAKGMKVIGLTGHTGGRIKALCDILLNVPETATHAVQELHLPIYHSICLITERHFFPTLKP